MNGIVHTLHFTELLHSVYYTHYCHSCGVYIKYYTIHILKCLRAIYTPQGSSELWEIINSGRCVCTLFMHYSSAKCLSSVRPSHYKCILLPHKWGIYYDNAFGFDSFIRCYINPIENMFIIINNFENNFKLSLQSKISV